MDTPAIETMNLDFSFRKDSLTISSLNIKVGKGTIYGFLGPNGSGKTTSIRLLLGLLAPSNGTVMLFGSDLKKETPGIFSRLGTLVETPSLFNHLSAFDNLKIVQRIKKTPVKAINESLTLVGLSNVANKTVGKFSLGMKQRLGLAIALLSDPELLILDEPSNSLDPSGMLEIRQLLLNLNKEKGTTIIISSHLLAEIEKMVSHVGILNDGKLIFQDTIGKLQQLQQPALYIKTNNPDGVEKLLQHVFPAKHNEEIVEVSIRNDEDVSAIAKKLIENGFDIYDLHVSRGNLENIFISITNKKS
jgi:lantibiotic transport system ATP-binding protein